MEFHVAWNFAPLPRYEKKPKFQVAWNNDHSGKNMDFPVAGNLIHIDR